MVDRLRTLLEEPHDPVVARAVIVLACAVTFGLTIVVGLGGASRSDVTSSRKPTPRASTATTPVRRVAPQGRRSAARHYTRLSQDPQDRSGSAAARRARRELASHRALQHVPYRRRGTTITLVGVHGNRAVLRVGAASLADARRGWRRFLRRYLDAGRAYLPLFRMKGARRG